MAKVKGTFFINRIRYLDEKCTSDDKQKVLEAVNPELRQTLERGLLPIKWYACSDYTEFLRVMKKVLGPNNADFYTDLGKFSATVSLNTLYKMFLKIGSVESSLKKVPFLWKQLIDAGVASTTITEKNSALIKVDDFEDLTTEFCETLNGWIVGAIELCGGKNIKVKIEDMQLSGKKSVEYLCTWS